MKQKRIAVLLAIMMLASTSYAFAASTPLSKTYNVTTTDKTYASWTIENLGTGTLRDVPEQIEEDGKMYHAVDLQVSLSSTEKVLKREKTYEALKKKAVPAEATFDGKKLQLEDVKWSENIRRPATGTITYEGSSKQPDPPKTKSVTANLPDGSTITVDAPLIKITSSKGGYTKPFKVQATFYGDEDVEYYKLGDKRIPNNPETPAFEGYESVLLQQLGLNDDYKLTSAKWTSDYFIAQNGETARTAEFSGLRRELNWTAYYEETLTENSPGRVSYDAVATYSNGLTQDVNELNVTVSYEPEKFWTLKRIIIASLCAIVVLAIAAAWILTILRKKRKKDEIDIEEYK